MKKDETVATQDVAGMDETTRVAKALSHPLRAQILRRLNSAPSSPVKLAKMFDAPVARVAYHVKLLEELDCIELVELVPRRGSVEHFYRATRKLVLSDDDWGELPANARSGLAAETFRLSVADTRAALEAGGFEARDDVHISISYLELDDEAWEHVATRLREVVEEANELSAQAIAKGDEGPERTRAGLTVAFYPRAEAAPDRS